MADDIQNIECKTHFSYQCSHQNTEWQPIVFFSHISGVFRSTLNHLRVIELNQSLVLLHAEVWRGSSGMFHGVCLFLDCINKNFCLSWSICYHCCFADFVLPTSNLSGKFWISLPKSNSHSFEYIRTILWCRQIFSLQLYTQQKAERLRLWNTNKALKRCGKKNRPLLYQPNKRASVIYLEKHGTQVCKKQSRWFDNWPLEFFPRRTKRKNQRRCRCLRGLRGARKPGRDTRWMSPNRDHSWLRKLPEHKMLRKWEVLRRKYRICLPFSHFFLGVHLWSLLATNFSRWLDGPCLNQYRRFYGLRFLL